MPSLQTGKEMLKRIVKDRTILMPAEKSEKITPEAAEAYTRISKDFIFLLAQ